MPPELIPDDEEYASEEDSDFAPDAGLGNASDDSASESEADEETVPVKHAKAKRKPGKDEGPEDLGIENSGDEAIIEKGLKRQRKKGRKSHDADDEGGEGGLIKTRSMKAQEQVQKRPLVDASKSTVDVDALWANMIAGKPATPINPLEVTTTTERKSTTPTAQRETVKPLIDRQASKETTTFSNGPDAMIMIKRIYNFAGKVHTEQKLVSRHSQEAKLYLASQKEALPEEKESDSPITKLKRPTKKARRSVFEPVVENLPVRTDLHFGMRKDTSGVSKTDLHKEAKKLTTVEKSAMDWAGFVDKEGIADELDAAGKAKGAFKDRQEFLARVENKREDEARRARMAGRA